MRALSKERVVGGEPKQSERSVAPHPPLLRAGAAAASAAASQKSRERGCARTVFRILARCLQLEIEVFDAGVSKLTVPAYGVLRPEACCSASIPDLMAETSAAKEQRAALLDAAPLCAVALDREGKACACNKLFTSLMGQLFKYSQYAFAKAAATDVASRKLQEAFNAVCTGESPRVRLRNIEMLTLAGESGLPIKAHFDWFIGPGERTGEVLLLGDPCSDDILAQREKDAELIDFFQNAPIALHWLSGTGHVMWANQTELDVLGYTAEEYIGQPIMKFCPDEEELVLEMFKTLGSGNVIKDVPVRFRTKSGKVVPLLIDSNVAYKVDEKGERTFNHTRCFIRDDTGRRVREARVEALLKASPAPQTAPQNALPALKCTLNPYPTLDPCSIPPVFLRVYFFTHSTLCRSCLTPYPAAALAYPYPAASLASLPRRRSDPRSSSTPSSRAPSIWSGRPATSCSSRSGCSLQTWRRS